MKSIFGGRLISANLVDGLYKFIVTPSLARKVIFVSAMSLAFLVVIMGIKTLPTDTGPLITVALQFLAALASVLFFAGFFLLLDTSSAKNQFEACVDEIQAIAQKQGQFGISNIFRGDKFFRIVTRLDIEPGDQIDILWSFLQHEDVTDQFFEYVERKNVSVNILLFLPFGYAMRQRMQDVRRDYTEESFSAVTAKSLANMDFLRRYAEHARKSDSKVWLAYGEDPDASEQVSPLAKAPIDIESKNNWPLRETSDLWRRSDPEQEGDASHPIAPLRSDLPARAVVDRVRAQIEDFMAELKALEPGAVTAMQVARPDDRRGDAAGGRPTKPRVVLRYTDLYTARPMIIVRRKDNQPRLVAMGMFLNNESSKYPFVVYRRPIDDNPGEGGLGREVVNICDDAGDHFERRFRQARHWMQLAKVFEPTVKQRFQEFVDDLEEASSGGGAADGEAPVPAEPSARSVGGRRAR